MAKKNKLLNYGLIFIGGLILLIFLFSFVGGIPNPVFTNEPKKAIECNVKIGLTAIMQKPRLDEVSCTTKQCGLIDSLQSLSILNRKGSVELQYSPYSSSASYDLNKLIRRSETKTLRLCVPQSSSNGKIVLYDQDGNFMEDKFTGI